MIRSIAMETVASCWCVLCTPHPAHAGSRLLMPEPSPHSTSTPPRHCCPIVLHYLGTDTVATVLSKYVFIIASQFHYCENVIIASQVTLTLYCIFQYLLHFDQPPFPPPVCFALWSFICGKDNLNIWPISNILIVTKLLNATFLRADTEYSSVWTELNWCLHKWAILMETPTSVGAGVLGPFWVGTQLRSVQGGWGGMWNASYFRGNMKTENPPLLLPDLDLDKFCFSL